MKILPILALGAYLIGCDTPNPAAPQTSGNSIDSITVNEQQQEPNCTDHSIMYAGNKGHMAQFSMDDLSTGYLAPGVGFQFSNGVMIMNKGVLPDSNGANFALYNGRAELDFDRPDLSGSLVSGQPVLYRICDE